MAIYGSISSATTNVVNGAFPLPPSLFGPRAKITLTRTMDAATTATFSGEGVTETQISDLVFGYKPGDRASVFGEELEVSSFGYTRQQYVVDGKPVDRFSYNIQFRQNDKDIEILDELPKGSGKSFLPGDIVQDGENVKNLFRGGYIDAELTYGDQLQSEGETEPEQGEPRTIFRLKDVKTEEFEEGDDDVTLPPVNTYVLRDLTSNFDETGPKKMVKKTKRKAGQIDSEEITTYGFAYLASDIDIGDGFLYTEEPGLYWKPIEYKQTDYYYQDAGESSFDLVVTPSGEGQQNSIKYIVHPDYAQFASVSATGSGISFKSNVEYLVKTVTKGWKLVRFYKETENYESTDIDDPYYPLVQFVQIPFYSETYYKLQSTRAQYGESVPLPFRVEFVDYKSLPLSIRSAFAKQDITQDGKVAIVYPDPNYVEPLFIEAEQTFSNSFAWREDPDAEADPDVLIPGTNRMKPAPRLTTGEESFSSVKRKIINEDRYTEYIVEYSSQDPGFDNAAERFSFREVSGTPPEPQYRQRQYEASQVPNGQIILSSTKKREIQLVTAWMSTPEGTRELEREELEKGGSINIPEAKTLKDALDKIELDLKKAYAQNSPSQRTVFSFEPGIKPGNSIIFAKDRLKSKVVLSSTVTLESRGSNNSVGRFIVTTPGTQITSGPLEGVKTKLKKKTVPDESEYPKSFQDAQIDVNITGTPGSIGMFFPILPGRRNF